MKSKQIHNTELQNDNQVSYKQSHQALKAVETWVLDDETEFFKKISFFLEHLSQTNSQVY